MQYYAIIVAGGSGKRMEAALPKQFLSLNGKPVLFHTIEAFHHSLFNPEIIVVLDAAQQDYWKALCVEHKVTIPHLLACGGAERFDSVKNALKMISGDGIVAVHDAVRPLVSAGLINRIYKAAEEKGNAVAAVRPSDSVRYKNKALDRAEVWLMQTPQAFELKIIRQAYQQAFNKEFTDDASAAEAAGIPINIVEGERSNVKITWPEDLLMAGACLENKPKK